MTHEQLVSTVDSNKHYFDEIEFKSWDDLNQLSDNELMEFINTLDEAINDNEASVNNLVEMYNYERNEAELAYNNY